MTSRQELQTRASMLAIYNFVPNFCAQCGRETGLKSDRIAFYNYQLRANMSCACGMHFQRSKTNHMVDAARQSEGDTDVVLANEESGDTVSPVNSSNEAFDTPPVRRTADLGKKKAG
jgi:hypothetical protein